MAALFSFSDVGVVSGGAPLLDGIDLQVPATGITVVVGPSGSGKTTLLRLCNRLEVPAAGTIAYRGRHLDDLDPRALRRRVGMIFQRPTLLGGTVRDNLAVADPTATEARRWEILNRVEIAPPMLDREAATLSGGEAQRVCIARALMTEPEALLADEPTAALDVGLRGGIERLARRLADDGMPMLWVTHDLDQARRLADHLVVLIGGRVREAGDPAAIGRSEDRQVRAFLAGELHAG